MFGFRIAISAAASLFVCLVFAVAQTASVNAQGSALPPWLAPVSGARDVQISGETEIVSSYRVSRAPADVVAHYREQFQKSTIHFNVGSDGLGTVIRCSEGKEYCVVQIRDGDGDTFVKVSYSASAGSAVGVVAPRETAGSTPADSSATRPPVSSPAAPPKVEDQPGSHQVEYVIEGTATVAGLTYRNSGGGTEQNDVVLPATIRFRMTAGAFASISAQKKGEGGVIRVRIKVDGAVMRQSTSAAPYGIASASGRVVDRKFIY